MADFKLKMFVPTERQEHLALMKWIALQPKIRDLFVHIPNEGKRSVLEGYVLRRLGLRRGVSDFLLPLPTKSYHGLWIELKRKDGGKESIEQKQWINKMRSLGYAAFFARGCDEAIKIISTYLQEGEEKKE